MGIYGARRMTEDELILYLSGGKLPWNMLEQISTDFESQWDAIEVAAKRAYEAYLEIAPKISEKIQ